jgi:predicted ATP-dependent serine protease
MSNNPFVAAATATENTTKRAWDMGMSSGGLRKLSNVKVPDRFLERMAFGIPVFNTLFNGDGLIGGQRITVAAPRGSGKTTFLLAGLQSLVKTNCGLKAAYISNEECVEQLAYTATRLNCLDVMADNMTDIDEIAELMKKLDVMVLDSVAGLTCSHIHRSPQLRDEYALNALCKSAQDNECTIFFIQHFTKDGKEKGNSGWGHAVDTCMSIYKMDSEEYGEGVRLFEVDKNRFGSGAEVMLRMGKNGFDYENPVEEKNTNDTPGATGVYIKAKRAHTQAILREIRDHNTNGGAKLQDFGKLDIDMGRVERLLKELVSRGVVCAVGGGKGQSKDTKRWMLGDTEEEDFGDEA